MRLARRMTPSMCHAQVISAIKRCYPRATCCNTKKVIDENYRNNTTYEIGL